MVTETFNETFQVSRSGPECWSVLVDVPRVSGWVTIVGDVNELDPLARYSAVLEDRLGPFKLRADLDVIVTDVVEAERITIKADGEDRQVGSRITVDATLGLGATDGGTQVAINGTYEVTGRVATMGASTIRQKAAKILDEFVSAAKLDLA